MKAYWVSCFEGPPPSAFSLTEAQIGSDEMVPIYGMVDICWQMAW